MDYGLYFVLAILGLAAALHPRTSLFIRYVRNGYSLRRAWRLAERA